MPVAKTFNFKEVSVVIGVQAISGFHEGSMLEFEPSTDQSAAVVGGDGEVSRAMSNDYGGMLKLTLQQTSKSNDYLSTLMNLDRAGGLGVVPFLMRDAKGTTLVSSESCWIKRMPNLTYAKGQVEGRTWEIYIAQPDIFVGGN